MELALATAIGVLTAIGIYLLLRARSFDVILGMTFLSYATNLLIFAGGRVVLGKAPVLQEGVDSHLGNYTDPLPQALTLTAIVITFAVSAFLLALIYRSWQLGQADTVTDDETDIAVRERGAVSEDTMDDETELGGDEATTDFVGVETAPITVLGSRDVAGIVDDAPADRPAPRAPRDGDGGDGS